MINRSSIYLIAALFLLAFVGYPAAAWFLGKQVEATLDEQSMALHDLIPFVTLSDRKYDRGVFSSDETVTVTVAPTPLALPIRLILTSKIRHLPLLGMFDLDKATIDSEVTVNDDAKQDASERKARRNGVAIHTALHFSGDGDTILTVPALNSSRLSSDEATLKIRFSKELASYSLEGNAPKIVIRNIAGNRLQISGIHFQSNRERLSPEEPALYGGSDHFAIETIDAGGATMSAAPLYIKKFSVDQISTFDRSNGFVDYASKIGVTAFRIGDKDYGPAEFNTSLHHLDARALARLNDAFQNANGKIAAHTLTYSELIAANTPLVQDLLTHDPDFRIDRLSFTRPDGESTLSALVKFKDAQPSDFANRMAALAKLYVMADIKVPERLVSDLAPNNIALVSQSVNNVNDQIAAMVADGYLTREDGFLKTRCEFHDGKLWFNGKEFVRPPPTISVNPDPLSRPASISRPESNVQSLRIMTGTPMVGVARSEFTKPTGVVRCTDPSGRTTYTDKPCATKDKMHEMPAVITESNAWQSGAQAGPSGAGMAARHVRELALARASAPLTPLVLQCVATRYRSWTQANYPLADKDAQEAKLNEFNDECRKIFHVR
ncbi:MAG: YdgA family protein [Thiobacillaceae bacterium]